MRVQALDRTFDILELLSQYENGLGVTEISRRLGLHKSTVSRLLHALRGRGYIDKDPATGLYRLGLKFIELSSAHLDNLELRIEAKPAMYELAAGTGQTVFLAIRRDDQVVYIDKTESYNSLRRYSIIGTTAPLHCTALGKALVSDLSEAALEELFGGSVLPVRTQNTLSKTEGLVADLMLVRNRGYSVDDEENEPGVRCVAAPVYDYRSDIIAAISVSGYSQSLTPKRLPGLGARVREAATKISQRMGYRPGGRAGTLHGRPRGDSLSR